MDVNLYITATHPILNNIEEMIIDGQCMNKDTKYKNNEIGFVDDVNIEHAFYLNTGEVNEINENIPSATNSKYCTHETYKQRSTENQNFTKKNTKSSPENMNNEEVKADTFTSEYTKELELEMMKKLIEIKSKWQKLCENFTSLDNSNFEQFDFEQIDKMFEDLGMSLEMPNPIVSLEVNQKKDNTCKVESLQETSCDSAGQNEKPLIDLVDVRQTFSQVFKKYKKNNKMIPGTKVSVHQLMSIIFDTKEMEVNSMKKWLYSVNSKKSICGMEGVMAVVHAFNMKNHLFNLNCKSKIKTTNCDNHDGMADIIWQAGDGKSATVIRYEEQYSHTRIFECIEAHVCFNISDVKLHLKSIYKSPQPPIALILSTMLTRGLDQIQVDLSYSKEKTLLTAEGNETWSLILLLLIGQAVGHVMHTQFPKNWTPIRSPIGILSLDEYGEKVYVSPFFKTPRFPLWLIHYCHDGNHYSLLFGHCKQLLSDWKEEKNFTLHHWDFDDKQMKTVQIITTGRITQDPDESRDVLEMIVRTKWPIANICIKTCIEKIGQFLEKFPSLEYSVF